MTEDPLRCLLPRILGGDITPRLTQRTPIPRIECLFQPYTPVSPGISEGDYTEWAHKWTKTLPGGLEYSEGLSIEIDETHNVINIGYSDTSGYQRFGIFNISDFSTIFISTASQNFHDAGFYMNGTGIDLQLVDEVVGFSRSLISYIIIARADEKTIEVFRGGTSALWSRNIQNDESGQTMGGMMMSNLGKYIIVATAQKNLMLYEGS